MTCTKIPKGQRSDHYVTCHIETLKHWAGKPVCFFDVPGGL